MEWFDRFSIWIKREICRSVLLWGLGTLLEKRCIKCHCWHCCGWFQPTLITWQRLNPPKSWDPPRDDLKNQVRSYLLYKRIQHQWLVRNSAERMQEHQKYAKLPLVPTLVTPEGKGLQDSTPIIEQLEVQFPERSIYPNSAVGKFMSQLLEEFGDEWGCLVLRVGRGTKFFIFVFFDVEAAVFKIIYIYIIYIYPRWVQDRFI